MNLPTAERHHHAPTSTVIRVEIISNDAVDHLRTLRAVNGSNPQQTSRILRAPRIPLLAIRAAKKRPLFRG